MPATKENYSGNDDAVSVAEVSTKLRVISATIASKGETMNRNLRGIVALWGMIKAFGHEKYLLLLPVLLPPRRR